MATRRTSIEELRKSADVYRHLMEETKYRIEAIDTILSGRAGLRQRIAQETCYLQFRLICETIAIACLALHRDIKVSSGLHNTYKADWILNALDRLHPRFYPSP